MSDPTRFQTNLKPIDGAQRHARDAAPVLWGLALAARILGWAARMLRALAGARWRLWLPMIAAALMLLIPPLAVRAWAATSLGIVLGFMPAALLGYTLVVLVLMLCAAGLVLYQLGKWWDSEDTRDRWQGAVESQADLTNTPQTTHISHNDGVHCVSGNRPPDPRGGEGRGHD